MNPEQRLSQRLLEILQEIPAIYSSESGAPAAMPVALFDRYVSLLRETWLWLGYIEDDSSASKPAALGNVDRAAAVARPKVAASAG
jgi:hypothetical protein